MTAFNLLANAANRIRNVWVNYLSVVPIYLDDAVITEDPPKWSRE